MNDKENENQHVARRKDSYQHIGSRSKNRHQIHHCGKTYNALINNLDNNEKHTHDSANT